MGKDKYLYLKDDAALEKFREENKNRSYTIKHLKGLGEMSAEETEILVNPDQRIIKQITVEDEEETDDLFEKLMGTQITPRKEFIKQHSAEAVYTY